MVRLSYDMEGDSDIDELRQPRRRIHPFLYLIALSTAAAALCLLSLGGIANQLSYPSHDELLSYSESGSLQSDPADSAASIPVSALDWNSLPNALGGFSTCYVHSPQLNVSWLSRPAAFGARITSQAGLQGRLESIARHPAVSSDINAHDVDMDKAKKGCQVDLSQRLSSNYKDGGEARIALIERGDCPFLTKLLNAQALGYQAAIMYNIPTHTLNPARPSTDDDEENALISMWAPSREASRLRIPSVFVGYNTGRTLENLMHIAEKHEEEFQVVLESEVPPRLLLMDVIIMLFFLPTLFTTAVIIVSKVRQIRHRQQQRAPQSLVDSLPSFKWRDDLDIDLEALDIGEKDVELTASEDALAQVTDKSVQRRLYSSSKIAKIISKALYSSPVTIDEQQPLVAGPKVSHLSRKIFSQKECAICLADFMTDEDVRLLPCGHLFHVREIDSWLTQQRRWCPVCRTPIDGDEEAPAGADDATSDPVPNEAPAPASAVSAAQPIITREDAETESEDYPYYPVAGSSGVTERTPLLPESKQ